MGFSDAIRVGASGAAGAYTVDRSLRLNEPDSAYLARTPSSTSSRTTWTLSFWVKRSLLGQTQGLFGTTGSDNNTVTEFFFSSGNNLAWGAQSKEYWRTTRLFRDTNAWYHIVIVCDTTNSTQADRQPVYINGVRETSFTDQNLTGDSTEFGINRTVSHSIGRRPHGGDYFGGYLAEINFIDGQAYDPSYFAETNSDTGQWVPKKYAGSYGTNGFYLKFSDNSGTTATTLGKDSSGNSNNWTPNNFSVAANLANDSMPDTPTNNFCTLNPLNATSSFNFGAGEGNLVFDQSSNDQAITGTFFVTSGKWYWEIYKNSGQNPEIGIVPQFTFSAQSNGSGLTTGVAFITNGGNLRNGNNGTASITGGSAQTGAGWIRIACDMDNKKIWFSDTSGNYFNSGNPATGANAAFDFSSVEVANGWTPYIFMGTGSGHNCYVNFGQFELNSFSSNIPAGFKTLSSANLPDPTILLPNKHFDTDLYTGTGSSLSRSAFNFQPDWLWFKSRSTASNNHALYDSVRGRAVGLSSDETYSEFTSSASNDLVSFDNDGFTLGGNQNFASVNGSGTKVAWAWNGGDTDGKTYTVKVVSDSGNKYRFDDFGTSAVTLDLAEGGTYIFDQSDSSNSGHPLRFSTTSNGTHGGGSEYTTGVTTNGTAGQAGAYTQIVVAASAPTLYYYCTVHSGMGGQANTNSTLGSSNFDGTTQSTAKVNATAGFSIVTYTGTGSNTNIGHGLGVAPQVVITKARSATSGWAVLHTVGDPNAEYRLVLNDNNGYSSYQGGNLWNDTVPTSTHFRVSSDDSTNASSVAYIGYVFSEVAGYSKFGKYTGNGNADGPFVFTGFRPAFVLIKRTNASNNWFLQDDKRLGFNPSNSYLEADTNLAEQAETDIDILSNGFKCRSTGNGHNNSSGTYIYFAFAESPFKNARAR